MRGTLNRSLNPRSAVSRWGHKLGHTGGGGTETPGGARAGAGAGDGDDEQQPPLLGAMTIDRVVEQLFFVRVSVYNARGKLSEPQQVGVVYIQFCRFSHTEPLLLEVWLFVCIRKHAVAGILGGVAIVTQPLQPLQPLQGSGGFRRILFLASNQSGGAVDPTTFREAL